MKKIINILINLILVIILVYSSYNIYLRIKDYKAAKSTYDKIRELKNIDNSESDNSIDNLTNKLSKVNSDYKFWIKVDNTNIDYPVVQGSDNGFYLSKDFNKNSSRSGSIFIDFRNDINYDKNIIIYGHNMKNKTMFSHLEKFKKEDFFNQSNKIKIFFDNKEYTYEVFSVYYTKSDYNYIVTNFDGDESYKSYLNNISNKSIYNFNNNININDKIITLSTCSYEAKDTRTVIHAKLISIND